MAITEAGTQYLAILSQPEACIMALRGPVQGVLCPLLSSGNVLLCFVPHVQPGTGFAYWVTSLCDWRIQ
jgi:hypothetical protein